MCVSIFSTPCVWNVSHAKKKWGLFIGIHIKYPLLSDLNAIYISSTDFWKKMFKYKISRKSIQWDLICSKRTTFDYTDAVCRSNGRVFNETGANCQHNQVPTPTTNSKRSSGSTSHHIPTALHLWFQVRIRCSSVTVVTRILAGRPRTRRLISASGNWFFSSPNCTHRVWGPPSFALTAYRGVFSMEKTAVGWS